MPYTYVLVLGVECSDRSVESDSYDVKSIHISGEREGGRQQKIERERERERFALQVRTGVAHFMQ